MELTWQGVKQRANFVARHGATVEARWATPSDQFITTQFATEEARKAAISAAVRKWRFDEIFKSMAPGAVDRDLENLWGTSGRVPQY